MAVLYQRDAADRDREKLKQEAKAALDAKTAAQEVRVHESRNPTAPHARACRCFTDHGHPSCAFPPTVLPTHRLPRRRSLRRQRT